MAAFEQTRRAFLKAAGLGVAALATPGALRGAEAESKRPNILFLFTDDQRFSTLNALNNRAVRTPNLNRLLRNGTAFTHAFIQGSTSGAVCICSRAMLLSGRNLYQAPLNPKRAEDGVALWPETFRESGYATFATGKWHNGPEAFARSFADGANIFFGGMSNHSQVPVYDFDPSGAYPPEASHIAEGFSSEIFSDSAVEFLERQKGEQPFFAYVAYTAPHDPRTVPKEYADLYDPALLEVPENFAPEHPFDNGEMRIRDEKLAPWPRTPEIVREHLAAYYGMITHVDAQIGRVLDALEASGHAENTIVVFASDNGLAVGQHGLMGKQNLYEHSIRVPLILSGPGIEPGRQIDSLVYLHDLFPTTCDLAGIETPATVESLSLAPLLAGEVASVRDSVFTTYKTVQKSVRTERYKLIRYLYVKRTQLFDLDTDPNEIRDLSDDPQYDPLVEELSAQLKEWQALVGDETDLDDPPPLENLQEWGPPPSPGAPIRPNRRGEFILEPKDAEIGGRLAYEREGNRLGAWDDPRDFPTWSIVDATPGMYEVECTYGCENPGAAYSILIGRRNLVARTESTGGLQKYKAFTLGRIEIQDRLARVLIKPARFEKTFMTFRQACLKPLKERTGSGERSVER